MKRGVWSNLQGAIRDGPPPEQIIQSLSAVADCSLARLHDHEQVLLGGNALFHVKGDSVTRSDWRHYVSALNLGANHPGILGVGYSVWLTPAQKEANVRTWLLLNMRLSSDRVSPA